MSFFFLEEGFIRNSQTACKCRLSWGNFEAVAKNLNIILYYLLLIYFFRIIRDFIA